MGNLDRAEIVELLGRLGDQNQDTVVAAARELHRKVIESDLTWDDVVRSEASFADAGVEPKDEPAAEASAGDSAGDDRALDAGKAEATRLIGRLLARKDLSDNLRGELADLKRSIADGSLDAMDSRYIRALAKRLGA